MAWLERGNYTVNVNAPGYEPESIKVGLSGLSKKDLAIYLKRISKNQGSPKAGSISTHELSMPVKARNFMESGKKKLYQDKDSAGGVVNFEQAISLAPGYYEAHFQLAMAYLAVGKSGEAEKHFRKSIELSGDKYGKADVELGTMMLDQGYFPEGEKTIGRGIALNPNLWLGYYELGRAFLNDKRVSEAQSSAEPDSPAGNRAKELRE